MFNLCFCGDDKIPPDAPNWKKAKWDVWYQDPHELIHNILQNPDFHTQFDYTPYQEYDLDGNHHFHNGLSGDWCWHEAVSKFIVYFYYTNIIFIIEYHC